MINKFSAMLLILVLLLLGGCQLAVENDNTVQSQDVLCGVFVTLEPIEPAPADTVIELPADWNGNIEDVLFNEEDSRIYATRHEEENGHVDYTFDGVDGIRMFSITIESGEESYNAAIRDDLWQDGSNNYTITDNGSDIKLSGTLCFDLHYPLKIFTNPVYQTADGRVYCTYGDGYYIEGPEQQSGECGSTTISATTTLTVNGEETSHSLEAVVKLACANTNKQIILKQMDDADQVIEQTVITKENIPESIRVLPDTAYMIMEEHGVGIDGRNVVNRTMIKMDEELLGVRFTGEKGIVESYPVTLVHKIQTDMR